MEDCGFCLSPADDAFSDILENGVVRSRKPFRCCECQRKFQPGTKYERLKAVFCGEILIYKTCFDCANIRRAFACDGGAAMGGLWEDLMEYGFEAMTTGCIARVETASAKAYLQEQWRKWKGLV